MFIFRSAYTRKKTVDIPEEMSLIGRRTSDSAPVQRPSRGVHPAANINIRLTSRERKQKTFCSIKRELGLMTLTTRTFFLRAAVYRACVRVGGALKSPVRGGKSRRLVVVVPLSGQVVSRRPAIHSLARSRPSLRAEAVRWTVSGRLAARNVSMKEMFGKYVHGSEISKCCQETS